MIRRSLFFFSFLGFLFLPALASADCFSRNLSVGMEGNDVKKLQQLLNTLKESRIAETGIGSPGQETLYFGGKTKLAVIRFQQHYPQETLIPAGLSTGTGYVGTLTRKKLETLCSPVTSTPSPQPPIASSSTKKTTVFFPSAYSGVPGATLLISGDQFTTKTPNTVYFGPYSISAVSQGSTELTVLVPSVPPGRYPLWVENAYGTSNKDAFFIVRDPSVPEPTLTSLSPSGGVGGTVVTIKGEGLTSKNELYTGLNMQKDVSSSAGVITWTVPSTFSGGTGTATLPVWIYVVNDKGVSNHLVFQLKI